MLPSLAATAITNPTFPIVRDLSLQGIRRYRRPVLNVSPSTPV